MSTQQLLKSFPPVRNWHWPANYAKAQRETVRRLREALKAKR